MKTGCYDCDRPYGNEHGFPDLIIHTYQWRKIAPDGAGNGLLCPSCICKRLHDAGVKDTVGAFASGPIRSISYELMHSLRQLENIQIDAERTRLHYAADYPCMWQGHMLDGDGRCWRCGLYPNPHSTYTTDNTSEEALKQAGEGE